MNNKMVIIIGAVMLACMVGFGAMFFLMWTKIDQLNSKSGLKGEGIKEEVSVIRKMGPIYSLDSFIVNLDDPKLRKYLRLTIDLEVINDKSILIVQERLPQVRDSILSILPAKRYEEITSVEGKNSLRAELLAAINVIFGKELITNIYFTEFVIQ